MTESVHRTNIGRLIVEALIIGVTQAIVLVALIIAISALLGNGQQKLLEQIRDGNRAQICVAALPLTVEGRSEAVVNDRCLIPNGIPPIDADGDGVTAGA